jgi:hypothetical protein
LQAFGDLPKAPWTTEIEELQRLLEAHGQKMKRPENEVNTLQRRIALTRVYLRMACPGIDQSTRTKLADSILALIDDQDLAVPQRRITDAQVVETVCRNSQCIRNQTGMCPLLVFGRQLAEEINEFFASEERSGDAF